MEQTNDPFTPDSESPVAVATSVPKLWERVVSSIPLLGLFLSFGLLPILGLRDAEKMYKEMDIAELPDLTEVVMLLASVGCYHPVALLMVFTCIGFLHFAWAGRTYQRLFWFDMIVAYLLIAFFWVSMLGFILPLVVIMERLGR